jgi:Na+/alanine symporter
MSSPWVLVGWIGTQWWYALPLIVAISLVYGATRHERMTPILYHAWRTAKWILGFMAVIVVILVIIALIP